jgi:lipopolysaccharide export system protein LptC
MTREADLLRDRRRHFALPGGSHDRLVRWLAILLPAGIGAVLAVMVVAPLFPRGEISFLLDRNKVATTEERLRVNNALYRGEDSRGRPFSLTASSAVQQSGKVPVVEMNDLSAKILLKDGPAELTAGKGRFDVDRNVVTVPGSIDLHAADGYRLTTSNITVDLRQQTFSGTGGVSGAVPTGTFQAGRMDVDLENRTVVLSGRARLQMRPGKLDVP